MLLHSLLPKTSSSLTEGNILFCLFDKSDEERGSQLPRSSWPLKKKKKSQVFCAFFPLTWLKCVCVCVCMYVCFTSLKCVLWWRIVVRPSVCRCIFKQPLSFPSCLKRGALGFQSCNPCSCCSSPVFASLPAPPLHFNPHLNMTRETTHTQTHTQTHTHTHRCLALSIRFVHAVRSLSFCACYFKKLHRSSSLSPHFLSPCLYSLFLSSSPLVSSSPPSASSFPFSLLIIRQQKHGVSCCRGVQMVFCFGPVCWHAHRAARSDPHSRCLKSKSQGIVEAVSSRIEQLRSVEKQLPPPPPPPPRGFSTTAWTAPLGDYNGSREV